MMSSVGAPIHTSTLIMAALTRDRRSASSLPRVSLASWVLANAYTPWHLARYRRLC